MRISAVLQAATPFVSSSPKSWIRERKMQEDMHYYGTYAMARAAGLSIDHAKTIAYAAQYVDDSTSRGSEVHADGGMFQAIATAHTGAEAIENAAVDHLEQRQVWVPFHFFPGGTGDSLSEQLVCHCDSALAQEMVSNHIEYATSVADQYGLELMGVTAHVYADTFAHYGFSGVSSRRNKVDGASFHLDVKDPGVKAYIMGKFSSFLTKYTPRFLVRNFRNFASHGASAATGALGHGAVGTYPDRPFLRWRFTYLNGDDSGWRENQKTYLEGCRKLHAAFSEFAVKAGISSNPVEFDAIEGQVKAVLAVEGAKDERIRAWKEAIEQDKLFVSDSNEALYYSQHDWEQQKDAFEYMKHSNEMLEKEVYRFHQAAIYHRDYTLKQLLPKHGIVVT